jgi:hypothetical protein
MIAAVTPVEQTSMMSLYEVSDLVPGEIVNANTPPL